MNQYQYLWTSYTVEKTARTCKNKYKEVTIYRTSIPFKRIRQLWRFKISKSRPNKNTKEIQKSSNLISVKKRLLKNIICSKKQPYATLFKLE